MVRHVRIVFDDEEFAMLKAELNDRGLTWKDWMLRRDLE